MRADDLVLADDGVGVPAAGRVERHPLDEPHLDALVPPEPGEVDDLVVVDAALHDGVDLDRIEPGLLGGGDPVEDAGQLVAARHRVEPLAVKRVEADVDAAQPGAPQAVGEEPERGAVGGHRHVDRAGVGLERGDLFDESREVGPDRRLAAGEPDRLDAIALDHQPGDPCHLLERQDLRARQPRHLLFHAIRAPEVAPVGDRDAQIADDPPEPIGEVDVPHPVSVRPNPDKGGTAICPDRSARLWARMRATWHE